MGRGRVQRVKHGREGGERDRSGVHAGERRRKPSHAKVADHPEFTTRLDEYECANELSFASLLASLHLYLNRAESRHLNRRSESGRKETRAEGVRKDTRTRTIAYYRLMSFYSSGG